MFQTVIQNKRYIDKISSFTKKIKVKVGNDREMTAAIRKKNPTPKTEVGKSQTNNQVLIIRKAAE